MGEGIAIGGTAIRSFGEGVREAKLRQMEEDQARVGKMMQLYDLNQRKIADASARQIGLARAGKAHTPEAMEADHQIESATSYQKTLEDSIAKGLAGKEGASQVKGLWNKLRGVIGIAKQTPIPLPEGSGTDQVTGKSMSQSGTIQRTPAQSVGIRPREYSLPTAGAAGTAPAQLPTDQSPITEGPTAAVTPVVPRGSIKINVDGKEVLIPTVSEDGRTMGDEEAIAEYRDTGKHLGQTSSPAQQTHPPFQWQRYNAQPTDMASIRREAYADLGQAAGRIPEKQMGEFILEKARGHVDDMMNALSGYVAHVKSTDTKADDTFEYAMKDPYFVKIFSSLQRLMIAPEKVLDSRDVENFMKSHFKDYRTHEELKATHPDTQMKLDLTSALELEFQPGVDGDLSKLPKQDQEFVTRTKKRAAAYYAQTRDTSVDEFQMAHLMKVRGMTQDQAYEHMMKDKLGGNVPGGHFVRSVNPVTGKEEWTFVPPGSAPKGDVPGTTVNTEHFMEEVSPTDPRVGPQGLIPGQKVFSVSKLINADKLAGAGKHFSVKQLSDVLAGLTYQPDKDKLNQYILQKQREQLAR